MNCCKNNHNNDLAKIAISILANLDKKIGFLIDFNIVTALFGSVNRRPVQRPCDVNDVHPYSATLTSFAHSLVNDQYLSFMNTADCPTGIADSHEGELAGGISSCSCGIYSTILLSSRHILRSRHAKGLSSFDAATLILDWWKSNLHKLFNTFQCMDMSSSDFCCVVSVCMSDQSFACSVFMVLYVYCVVFPSAYMQLFYSSKCNIICLVLQFSWILYNVVESQIWCFVWMYQLLSVSVCKTCGFQCTTFN